MAVRILDYVMDALQDSDPTTAELRYWCAARKPVLDAWGSYWLTNPLTATQSYNPSYPTSILAYQLTLNLRRNKYGADSKMSRIIGRRGSSSVGYIYMELRVCIYICTVDLRKKLENRDEKL